CGDFAVVEGSMLLMPIAPSVSVTLTTTPLLTLFETPPLVNVATRGLPMQNTSTLRIDAVIADLFRCLIDEKREYISVGKREFQAHALSRSAASRSPDAEG